MTIFVLAIIMLACFVSPWWLLMFLLPLIGVGLFIWLICYGISITVDAASDSFNKPREHHHYHHRRD